MLSSIHFMFVPVTYSIFDIRKFAIQFNFQFHTSAEFLNHGREFGSWLQNPGFGASVLGAPPRRGERLPWHVFEFCELSYD